MADRSFGSVIKGRTPDRQVDLPPLSGKSVEISLRVGTDPNSWNGVFRKIKAIQRSSGDSSFADGVTNISLKVVVYQLPSQI